MLNGKSPFEAQGAIPALWPTPTASSGGDGVRPSGYRRLLGPEARRRAMGDPGLTKRGGEWVPAETFPTPIAGDGKDRDTPKRLLGRIEKGKDLGLAGELMKRELFPTPKASASGPDFARASRDGSGGDDLATFVVKKEKFPTPTARDHNDAGPNVNYQRQADKSLLPGVVAVRNQAAGVTYVGPLNPDWVEWLMGYPLGWTDLEVEEPEEFPGWEVEPDIPRMAPLKKNRAKRLTALGNAVVPEVVEVVARRIQELAKLGG
jgi:site-specific DNA-cytosine methylase